MMKTLKTAVLLALALTVGGNAYAQVVETTTYDDGRVYTGQRNGRGKIEGQGMMTWPNGDRYEGQWKKGNQEGEGTYTWDLPFSERQYHGRRMERYGQWDGLPAMVRWHAL